MFESRTPLLRQRSGGDVSERRRAPSDFSDWGEAFAPSICSESRLRPGPEALPVPVVSPGAQASCCMSYLSQVPAIVVLVLMTAVNSVTYGLLVFKAPGLESVEVTRGITIWLVATFAGQVAITTFSSLPRALCAPTIEMLPLLHPIFTGFADELMDGEVFHTCLATCFLSTLSLGVLLFLSGYLGFSRYLRAFPLVVLKGALFGVAIFLMKSAVETSLPSGLDTLWEMPLHWSVAVGLGTLLFMIDQVLHSPIAVACYLVAIALAPTVIHFAGWATFETQRSSDFLFQAQQTSPWYEQILDMHPLMLSHANWRAALAQAPAISGLWLTHILCTLMDLKAIELLTQTEIDLDTELIAMGFGNILSSLSGASWPVYILCSMNVTCYKLGGRTRSVGLSMLVALVPLLFTITDAVPCLPRALPGCVAWWLGVSFMKETMLDIIRQHSHFVDVAIVASMSVVTVVAGLLQGLLFGFLLAVMAFLLQYTGSAAVVRALSDAHYFRSNMQRSLAQHVALERLGHRIAVIHVDGYLMFGSSPQLVDAVRPLLSDDGPDWVVLNFRGVRGLDYSAVLDLVTLGRRAAAGGRRIVLCELRGNVPKALARTGVKLQELMLEDAPRGPFGLCCTEHYNAALKCCEDAVLASAEIIPKSISLNVMESQDDAVMTMLAQAFGDYIDDEPAGTRESGLRELRRSFELQEHRSGTVLWKAGEPATKCFGVVSGHLHALADQVRAGEDTWLIEVVRMGAFVGYSGTFSDLGYGSTCLVPDDCEKCVGLSLSLDSFTKLTEQRPRLGLAVLRGFVRRSAYEFRDLSRIAAHT